MPVKTLHSRPSDDRGIGATWSLAVGAANASFPLTNLNSVYPDLVSKLTGTSGTYRATIASTALQAIALVNVNFPGVTVTITNNNGLNTTLAVPSLPADGVSLNAAKDLRAITTAATQWDIAIAGAPSNIAIGNILLISTLRELPVRWRVRPSERKPTIVHRTEYDIARGYRLGVRVRRWEFSLLREADRAAYTTLRRGSEGPTQPFLFWLDSDVNDPAYVWFPDEEWRHEHESLTLTHWTDVVEEMNPGQVL